MIYSFQCVIIRQGGCGDGLERQGVNGNQGAESTLAWLISLINMNTAMGLQFLFR